MSALILLRWSGEILFDSAIAWELYFCHFESATLAARFNAGYLGAALKTIDSLGNRPREVGGPFLTVPPAGGMTKLERTAAQHIEFSLRPFCWVDRHNLWERRCPGLYLPIVTG